MLDESARELLSSGVAIFVATRDAALTPELTSGVGLHVHDPATITVYLPVCPPTDQTLRNLEANGEIAATFCRASDDRSVQVKGTVRAVRAAGPEDRAIQELYRGALTEQYAQVGVPRCVSRRFRFSPSVAVEIVVREVYEQTPGPSAGARIAGAGR